MHPDARCVRLVIAELPDRSVRSCVIAGLLLRHRRSAARSGSADAAAAIHCYEDNALVKLVLGQDGRGGVLVVDGGGSLHTALLGDVIAASAVACHWAGVIIHGAVRDTAVLVGLDLGVKALGFNPRKSTKTGAGQVDAAVQFGGVQFYPASSCGATRTAWWCSTTGNCGLPETVGAGGHHGRDVVGHWVPGSTLWRQ